MIIRTVTIVNRAGMHTRPAAEIVRLASGFKSDFFINKDGFQINGKSIIGVMTLAAAQGTELEVQFVGEDEEQMADAICEYFARGFDEK